MDVICTDGVYGIFHETQHLRPHRKPSNGHLTNAEQRENEEITEFRGDQERIFGDLVNKFGILKKRFRHGDLVFNDEVRLCM
jgi:hypothetical protein